MMTIVAEYPTGELMKDTPLCKEALRAPVRLVRDRGFPELEVIRCPYCEQSHRHNVGTGDVRQYLGGRMAHCHPESYVPYDVWQSLPLWNGDVEYRLVLVEGRLSKREMDEHFPVADGMWSPLHVSRWRADCLAILPEFAAEYQQRHHGVSDQVSERQPITSDLRAQVWDKSQGHCWYCGVTLHPFRSFSVDHIHPVLHGGTNDLENLVPCCKACNSAKSARSVEEFRTYRGGGFFWFELMSSTSCRD